MKGGVKMSRFIIVIDERSVSVTDEDADLTNKFDHVRETTKQELVAKMAANYAAELMRMDKEKLMEIALLDMKKSRIFNPTQKQ